MNEILDKNLASSLLTASINTMNAVNGIQKQMVALSDQVGELKKGQESINQSIENHSQAIGLLVDTVNELTTQLKIVLDDESSIELFEALNKRHEADVISIRSKIEEHKPFNYTPAIEKLAETIQLLDESVTKVKETQEALSANHSSVLKEIEDLKSGYVQNTARLGELDFRLASMASGDNEEIDLEETIKNLQRYKLTD